MKQLEMCALLHFTSILQCCGQEVVDYYFYLIMKIAHRTISKGCSRGLYNGEVQRVNRGESAALSIYLLKR